MEGDLNSACLGIISVVNLVGNSLVVALFVKRRDWLKKAHACLLLALAIQDILTAISLLVLPGFILPVEVYTLPSKPKWRDLYCTLIWSWYVPFALSVVSIYTCLMLAIDRWVAVWKPWTYKRIFTSRKVVAAMIILPWFAGFGFEMGTTLGAQSKETSNGTFACKWVEAETSTNGITIILLLFIGKGALPAVLMTAVYTKMMIVLKESSSKVLPVVTETSIQRSSSGSSRDQSKSYLALKRIARMACAASAIVVMCWLPDQIYYCLFQLKFIEMDTSTHNGLHVLAFLNTCFNPFLYSFANRQYREEFKLILCCQFKRNTRARFEETMTERSLEERDGSSKP